jgi:hypothetical protein
MKKSWLVFSILLALLSCQNETQKLHLKQVDQLIKTTDSIRTVFIENKNDSIMYYISKVMDVEFRIRRSYKTDTINETFARKLDDYKQVRKKLKPVLKLIGQLEAGTVEELATLQKLKKDIESGAGDRSKYNDYLLFEQDKINDLNMVLKEIIDVQEKQLAVFNRHHQELYDFSMTLEHVIK